jgi:hypothetical protein
METARLQSPPTNKMNEGLPDERNLLVESAGQPCPEMDGSAFASLGDDSNSDVNIRLLPPPMRARRLTVRVRTLGCEAPRIAFDPERD